MMLLSKDFPPTVAGNGLYPAIPYIYIYKFRNMIRYIVTVMCLELPLLEHRTQTQNKFGI